MQVILATNTTFDCNSIPRTSITASTSRIIVAWHYRVESSQSVLQISSNLSGLLRVPVLHGLRHDRPFDNCHLSDFTVVCYVDVYATLSLRHKTCYALLSHRNAHLPSVLTSILQLTLLAANNDSNNDNINNAVTPHQHHRSHHTTTAAPQKCPPNNNNPPQLQRDPLASCAAPAMSTTPKANSGHPLAGSSS
jgi:hypothetical protein